MVNEETLQERIKRIEKKRGESWNNMNYEEKFCWLWYLPDKEV